MPRAIQYRRVALVGVLLLALLGLGQVRSEAHGTCSPLASPLQTGQSFVSFTGGYDCFGTNHGISVTLYIQRRTPGGAWSTVETKNLPPGVDVDRVTGIITHNAFNCAKDYRGRVTAGASPGGHSGAKNSTVKNHTC